MPLELVSRAADFRPQSINEGERTAEIVISTGAPVRRAGFVEVLDVAGCDASRPNIPLLDTHRQDSLDRVLGKVIRVWRDGDSLKAAVRFATTPAGITAFEAVKAGDFNAASVGYSIRKFQDALDPATGELVRNVLEWVLHEVSIVPVPADAGAFIRSDSMPTRAEPATAAGDAPAYIPAGHPVVINPVAAPAPDAPADPANDAARAAVAIEIRAMADTFGLGTDFTTRHLAAGSTADAARAEAVRLVQARMQRPPVSIIATHDPRPEEIATRMGEAIYARAVSAHKLSEPARQYAQLTTLDMARECLRMRGVSTVGLSPSDTITRALHTTSDFSAIFADTANRALRTGYEAAPQTMKAVARQTTARDFRAKTGIMLGEAPTLEKVNESGEYKYGTFAEAKESYAIDTYGKIVGLSRKAIINDDIGAFVGLAGKLGMAAAEFEGQFLVNLLQSGSGNGPTMDDTRALFHADHGNRAATGAAIAEATLSAARLAMRKQRGLSGTPINVTPRYLIVPPELETTAEKLLATINPNTTASVNPFGGKLELLVEARLSSATRWYVVADPAQVEGLEYAYLQGEEGPQTETRAGFNVDGVEVKVRLDFGAAFMDWRAWYMNAGA